MSAAGNRVRRSRKPPIVGARIAGREVGLLDYPGPPIYDKNSVGFLGQTYWFRVRVPRTGTTDAQRWRISTELAGHPVSVFAVIDDFGDLVAVSE